MDLVNWPGQIAVTVFTSGCNLRCPYCHNAELVKHNIKKEYTEDYVLSFLKKRTMVRNLVISGGEPTLNRDLPDFIRKVKDLKVRIKLDTNGTNPEMVQNLIDEGLVDYVAMDIKGPWSKYRLLGGEEYVDKMKMSLEILKKSDIIVEFRTTCSKDMLSEQDILDVLKISDGMPHSLQSFNPKVTLDPEWGKAKPWTREELEDLARPFPNVYVK